MPDTSHSTVSESYFLNTEHNIFQRKRSDNFDYNDGDQVENKLQEIISQAEDVSDGSAALFSKAYNWPSVYHLSPARANLLRPLEKNLREKKVLELGSGCGAISRFLAEAGCDLTCVEGSSRRAAITALRCRGFNNVRVFSDNFQDFDCEELFDVVTLIGVLEYSRAFIKGADPVAEALALARSFLKEDGVLLVAIENKLGLKYWAGAPEDHVGIPFFGLESLYSEKSPVTFGRRELECILRKADFSGLDFYYPFPDYKLPNLILTEQALGQPPAVLNNLLSSCFAPNQGGIYLRTFSEGAAYRSLIENGLIGDMANSFLVVAKKGNGNWISNTEDIAFTYTQGRQKALSKEVCLYKEGAKTLVRRRLLHAKTLPNLMHFDAIENLLPGETLFNNLIPLVNRVGWSIQDVVDWIRPLYINLLESSKEPAHKPMLPGHYIDASPFNFVGENGKYSFFDLEWNPCSEVEVDFVVFRGIFHSFLRIGTVAEPCIDRSLSIVNIASKVVEQLSGEPVKLQRYLQFEVDFQNQVTISKIDVNSFGATLDVRLSPDKLRLIAEQGNIALQANRSAITTLGSERQTLVKNHLSARPIECVATNELLSDLISKLHSIQILISSAKPETLSQSSATSAVNKHPNPPTDDQIRLEDARKLILAQDHDAAISILIDLASEDSCLPEVYIDLAGLAVLKGDREAAIDLLEVAMSKEEVPGESALQLAELLNKESRPLEALAALSQYLRRQPNDFRALSILKNAIEISTTLPPITWARLLADLRYQPATIYDGLMKNTQILNSIKKISRTDVD